MSVGVFDFFSGCGGTSKGFQNAGLVPAFALDIDCDSAQTFQNNFPNTVFSKTDITKFDPESITELVASHGMTLFCGCAPCQPFTKQNTLKPNKKADSRRSLLSHFGSLVSHHNPDYVFVENVPGIQRVSGNSTLTRFKRLLESLGYSVQVEVVESQKYGVPQRRRRLVLLASRFGSIGFPETTHDPKNGTPFSTVREWIAELPEIEAGETHPSFPNHRAAKLSPLNRKRIVATPPGGSRADWPKNLRLACHTKNGYSGHTDVYGRIVLPP